MGSAYYEWRHGNVHYVKRGMGEPLVLIHNIYPGASQEEFQHNIAELSRHFCVYAVDLLGFGDSDAPRRKYTARMYIDLIQDFIRDEIHEPAHVMSSGLSCAYVTAAAAEAPDLFGRLIFVCPRSEPTGLDLPRWAAPIRRVLLTMPGLGSGFYDAMACEYSIKQYLLQCFHQPRHVTPDLVRQIHENAYRPGSINAYASVVTGYLDYPLLAALPKVTSPILLVWGRQARPTPVEHSVRLLALSQNCQLEVIEQAGSWVHDEQSAKVDRVVTAFLDDELTALSPAKTA
jgi:pimeloyl-ACP methyl ester carboxylesterase